MLAEAVALRPLKILCLPSSQIPRHLIRQLPLIPQVRYVPEGTEQIPCLQRCQVTLVTLISLHIQMHRRCHQSTAIALMFW